MAALCFWTASILLFGASIVVPAPVQIPLLEDKYNAVVNSKGKPLTGRFLQVTDIHPDKFYEVYSSTEEKAACHRGRGPAGLYGAEVSDCDSPLDLVNQTFEWIEANLKYNIDFVVWTGDSARHDNDEGIPRSTSEVTELNEYMVQKMVEVFSKKKDDESDDMTNDVTVPIVPTFGNNDILPHNIMAPGPNFWTRAYMKIWRDFIPEEQRHQFEQGGWFYTEVIPNKLAVFSLNTIYFFDSNSAVDGCAIPNQPGYQQFEWLRIQLQFLRDRGMKAILTGHVAPARTETKKAWDETCWQKYALWMRQYSDVVSGTFWGHMNVDHFFLQDFEDIEEDTEKGRMSSLVEADAEDEEDVGDVDVKVSGDYLVSLRDLWAELPELPTNTAMDTEERLTDLSDIQPSEWEIDGPVVEVNGNKKVKKDKKARKELERIGGPFAERFAVSIVSPSVIPNYYPTIRVYEYNISGLDTPIEEVPAWEAEAQQLFAESVFSEYTIFEYEEEPLGDEPAKMMKGHKKKGPKKYKFKVPDPPSKSAPPGPAYSPQSLTLLGYEQRFANLTRINNDFVSESVTERPLSSDDVFRMKKWKEGNHEGKQPYDKDHKPKPKEFKYKMLYNTREDSVYDLPDLTVRSFLELAAKIGRFKPEKDDESLRAESGDYEHGGDGADRELNTEGSKRHKDKRHKRNMPWYTFVRRAFVGTMDEADIKEEFGH